MSNTPLDTAFATAMADQSQQMEFYGLLLQTELFFPVVNTAEEGGVVSEEAAQQGMIAPLLLEIEGAPVLPVFDTQERLAAWAEGTEMPFGGMPGYAIVEMAAAQEPTVQIAFNVGQESFHHMVADEIDWLHEAWQTMREPIDVDPGTELRMGVPEKDYSDLKSALSARMSDMPQIDRAYMVLVEGLSEDVPYDVCVVLDVNAPGEESRLAEELVATAAAHEPDGESVVISGGQPQILEFAQTETKPFYERLAA